jgi:putative holliday junction resolvase
LSKDSLQIELLRAANTNQGKLRKWRRVGEIDNRELSWPETGRLAGIDYGTVRIGVSICDPSRTWTSPLITIHRQQPALEAPLFQKLARDNQIVAWVVGLPIHCDGRDSVKAKEARDFARWLAETTSLPIRLVDERFSTAMANRLLREAELTHKQRKKQVDKIAATVILDAYLESSKHPNFRPITLENLGDAYVSLDH